MLGNSHKYDDIINLEHPTSKVHPRMSMLDRAAQFSPYDTLTGYDEAIDETARFTGEEFTLDESAVEIINYKLCQIAENIETRPSVAITYFVHDSQKDGGEYLTHVGVIKKIDADERRVVFEDKTEIEIDKIFDVKGDICGWESR